VYEAADILGVTVDAIRKRISRGSIAHERDDDGRVWVLLDDLETPTSKVHDTGQEPYRTVSAGEFIEEMRGRIEDLREQLAAERRANEENRRIIAALTSRIPELPPAATSQETPGASQERAPGERAPGEPGGSEPRSASEAAQRGSQRPWWRRMFGR
jgi:hypothetical protein